MKLGGGPPAAPPVTGGGGDESDAGDGPPAAAPPAGGAGGRTDPYGVIGAAAPPPGTPVADAGTPIDEPDAGAANGPGPILADAGAADTDVVAPAGGTPSGVDGVCGTGCAGVTGTPPAALAAPAAKLRPNSPPTADDIARAEACCTAAGFAALPAEPANPLAELPAGLPPPSSPDNGPIPPLAAPLNGELPPPPVDGSDGTCGIDGRLRFDGGRSVPGTVVRPITGPSRIWIRHRESRSIAVHRAWVRSPGSVPRPVGLGRAYDVGSGLVILPLCFGAVVLVGSSPAVTGSTAAVLAGWRELEFVAQHNGFVCNECS